MSVFKSVKVVGSAPDLSEVRRALAVLADPEHGCQLQRAPFHKEAFATFQGTDLDGMCAWVESQAHSEAIYFAINPVGQNLNQYALVPHIISRRWLFLDIDRFKTDQDKKLSATAVEKENARELTGEILEYLGGLGLPAPMLND